MGRTLRRREFLGVLGGAATWPISARTQPAVMPLVAFLSARPLNDSIQPLVSAFRQGLADAGYTDGSNLTIAYIWEVARIEQTTSLIAHLDRRPVSAIFAFGTVPAQVAKAATATIPIVFVTGDDPVARGLVTTLNRPGGNVTGISFVSAALASKRLQLLRSVVPKAELIGVLADAASPESQNQSADAQAAAQAIGQRLIVHSVDSDGDIDAAFDDFVRQKAGALLIAGGPALAAKGARLATLTERHRLPTMYTFRNFAPGGLMSYGASVREVMHQGGVYVGRVLRGEKPADLPVVQPTKFELVINAKTARALGLELSPMLLALADEVIE
jgi:putative ABC transport system substrate-binding protein